MRIEWMDLDDIPEPVRRCTEERIGQLARDCGRMRAIRISPRKIYGDEQTQIRLSCTCIERTRCLSVSRAQIEEGLGAFRQALRDRCLQSPSDPAQ